VIDSKPNGEKRDRPQLHHAAPEMGHPLHLYRQPADADAQSRGGPVVWVSETDAAKAGIVDNDWVEASTPTARWSRGRWSRSASGGHGLHVPRAGEDRETPGSEITGKRGGIHNSVTRTVLKPTHMIGGYAQLAYGFNYYGTVGSNRDEFVVVRKMKKVDWLDRPARRGEGGHE
jgi:nitrate reductase alpha subunit